MIRISRVMSILKGPLVSIDQHCRMGWKHSDF
jgi:hypothetical protein